MTKSPLASKTLWFNLVTLVMAIVALPEFVSMLPANFLPYIAIVNGLGNMVLRFMTTEPIV